MGGAEQAVKHSLATGLSEPPTNSQYAVNVNGHSQPRETEFRQQP